MKYILGLLLLTGCLVGPNFSPPEPLVECEWMECENKQIRCNDPFCSAWWDYFEDPDLNSIIGIAAAQNLSLKEAGMRVLQARAERGIAVGEFFPQLQQIVGSAQRYKISEAAPNTFAADLNYWDFISGLQVAWELDFWGKFRRGIEAANENLMATVANFQDVMVLLFSDVAATYVNMRTLQARIEILYRNIALQERSLEIVEARWRAGMVTDLDVQQARTLVFGTKSRLPVIETELCHAKNALAVLLGTVPDQIDCLIPYSAHIPSAPREIAVGIPAELLCRRPDVRRALHIAAAESAQIGIAVSELLPRISLNGFIGLEYSDSPLTKMRGDSKVLDVRNVTYIFGPSFAWPILNYGRLMNNVRAQYARFYQAGLAYQNQVLFAVKEAEDGLCAFIKSHEEVTELEQSVKAATRSTEVARTQYVEGIADYTRVLETDRSRLDEEDRLAIAQGKIALSLVTTYKALGGGWEPFICESE